MHGKRIKLQIWDTAGQERFRTITRVISDIRSWMRSIEQHASDNVNKILVGNKADMDDNKINFLLQSAKTSRNVEKAFFSITRDIKQRLDDTDSIKMLIVNEFECLFLHCSRQELVLVSTNVHKSRNVVVDEVTLMFEIKKEGEKYMYDEIEDV
ncbi:hypothetical protein RYX36_010897 [Vicia faba]